MRRPRHGGTSHPPLNRPGNGFGRPLRPGPYADVEALSDAEFRRELQRLLVDVDLITAERGDS